MDIHRCGSRPTRRAPADYFTGTVWQDVIAEAQAPGRAVAFRVTFEPGARTHWHTHPFGQILHVLSGCGRVQLEGKGVQEIRAGDSVWIAPGEKHWHGASPNNGMVHLALQEADSGKTATWMEPVTDAQFTAAPG